MAFTNELLIKIGVDWKAVQTGLTGVRTAVQEASKVIQSTSASVNESVEQAVVGTSNAAESASKAIDSAARATRGASSAFVTTSSAARAATTSFVTSASAAEGAATAFATTSSAARGAAGAITAVSSTMEHAAQGAARAQDAMTKATGRTAQGLHRMQGGANTANIAMMNFSRVVQDAPFGLIGVANNIDFLVQSLIQMRGETAQAGGVLKRLGSALIGPQGILLAFSLVTAIAVAFGDKIVAAFKKGSQAADDFKRRAKEALDAVIQFDAQIAGVVFTPQNIGGGIAAEERRVSRVRDRVAGFDEQEAELGRRFALAGDAQQRQAIRDQIQQVRLLRANEEVRLRNHERILERLRDQEAMFRLQRQTQSELLAIGGKLAGDPARAATGDPVTGSGPRARANTLEGFAGLVPQVEMMAPALNAASIAMKEVEEVTALANTQMTALTLAVAEHMTGAVDRLSFAVGNVVGGFESLGDAVKRTMQGVVADISAAIAKALILRSLVTIGGAIPVGALGGFGGFIGSALRSVGLGTLGRAIPSSAGVASISGSQISPAANGERLVGSISLRELKFALERTR